LRLDLAQYRELEVFTQFGTELDKMTQSQLTRGARLVEILKQEQYVPLPIWKQVLIIYCGTYGFLDDLPLAAIKKFETEFLKYIEQKFSTIVQEIEVKNELSDDLMRKIDAIINSFKGEFQSQFKK
jgi:F-type H+-transporting ATPase subunit alpha